MSPAFLANGFEILRGTIGMETIESLRLEVDRLVANGGTACLRNVCARSSEIAELSHDSVILSQLPKDYRLVRCILFDKTPASNWPVAWHQDLTIAVRERREVGGYGPWSIKEGVPHVQPPIELLENMVTLRVHLDPTPAENGALRVVAGSHRRGRIDAEKIRGLRDSETVTCACGVGEVLMMRPLILHSSKRSLMPKRRRVLHLEFASTEGLAAELEWAEAVDP